MSTKQKPKPRRLIVGALYLVETVEDTDTASHSIRRILCWTLRGWRDERGRKPRFACNSVVRRMRFSDATPYWRVVLLREYARKLEKAGDYMADWFPSSSTHRGRVVGQWREVRRARP